MHRYAFCTFLLVLVALSSCDIISPGEKIDVYDLELWVVGEGQGAVGKIQHGDLSCKEMRKIIDDFSKRVKKQLGRLETSWTALSGPNASGESIARYKATDAYLKYTRYLNAQHKACVAREK